MGIFKSIILVLSMALTCGMSVYAGEGANSSSSAISSGTSSHAYTVETLPIASIFGREKFVCNPDGILKQATVDSINNIMQLLEEDTDAQVLFVAVNAIEPADEEEFATALGNKLGVGDKTTNNGLVVLLVKELRAIHFATGIGMEKIMSNSECQSIQKKYMVKHFKKGDWDTGMQEGAVAISKHIRGELTSSDEKESSHKGLIGWLGIIGIAVLSYLIIDGSKCPRCKKKGFERVRKEYFKEGSTEKIRFIYKCPHCGYKKESVENRYKDFGGGKFKKGSGAGTKF